MLLIEQHINGNLHRLSNEWLPLVHMWDGYVASFASVQIAAKRRWGGYAAPVFGRIDLLPQVFAGDWPPPVTSTITAKLGSSSEADAVIMFDGIAHRERLKRDGIEYQLYGQGYSNMVTDGAYSGTLSSVFTTACNTLGLTLDTTAARSQSPDVDYTAKGDKMLLDNLSDMAAFFSHIFYIEAGTLYLIDMLRDNGTRELTEFDIFPSVYNDPPPVSLLRCTRDGNEFSVQGSHSHGSPISVSPCCHTAQANIEAALADIKEIVERPTVQLIKPLADPPKIGERISLTDASLPQLLEVWARVRKITWDFDNEQCIIEGEGGLT